MLVSSENIHRTACVNILDMCGGEGGCKESLVRNSIVNANEVTQIGAPVLGRNNDQVSSSSGDSDVGYGRACGPF